MSAPSFFRKSALEKLSTPEKLDQLIQITNSKAWIALVTVGLVIGTALSWGVWGKVKTKINVAGVMLGGEVYDIVSTTQGQLLQLEIQVGDVIEEGAVIASVDQPEIQQQIEAAKASIAERRIELQQLLSFGSKDTELQDELIQQQRRSIGQQITSLEKNIVFLKEQIEVDKDLLAKGLTTKPQLVSKEQQLENTQNQIEGLKAQMVEMSSQELNLDFNQQQKVNLLKQRIAQEERQLEQLHEQFKIKSTIKSPHSGRVVEVLTNEGVVVGLGTPLFKIKQDLIIADNGDIRGILYVPSQDGKKIKAGMEALVVPSTVQPQEFGYMKAKVTYVSDFPITQQGMMTSMKNDQLVQGLLAMGAPFEVHVDFEEDAETYSGYAWTSAKGPEIQIKEGTSCMGKITVKEEAPIVMVIPAFKKFFNLY